MKLPEKLQIYLNPHNDHWENVKEISQQIPQITIDIHCWLPYLEKKN